MRAIIVDDEPVMLKRFARLAAEIPDLNVVGQFESAEKALNYAAEQFFEAAFLDVAMPIKNGVQLAKELRLIRPDVIIVFVLQLDLHYRKARRHALDRQRDAVAAVEPIAPFAVDYILVIVADPGKRVLVDLIEIGDHRVTDVASISLVTCPLWKVCGWPRAIAPCRSRVAHTSSSGV